MLLGQDRVSALESKSSVQTEIEAALASGEWRAERKTPGPQATALGTSCPRF